MTTALTQLRESARAVAQVVRLRPLRRLLAAHAVLSIASWAASVAVTIYTFRAAGAEGVALQSVMALLPAAVAVPFTSTLADRYARTHVIVAAGVLRAVIVFVMVLLIVVGAPLAMVLLCSAAGGIVQSAIDPARQALVPELAEAPENLTAANVVATSIDSVSIFVGPALGGLLVALTSVEVVLAIVAAATLAAAALVSQIPARARQGARSEQDEPFARRMSAGARAVAGSPPLRLIVAFMAAQTMVDGLLGVLLAALALDLLDVGEGGLGLLNSAIGLGAVAGAAAAVGLVGRRRLAPSFVAGCILWGLPIAAIGLVPEPAVALVALAALGVGNTLVDVSAYTLLQRAAPDEVLGRVFGVLESAILVSISIGALLAPVLIAVIGLEGALVATGLFLPTLVVIGWPALRRLDAVLGPQVPQADLDLLRGAPIFAALGAPELERLARALQPVTLATGADAVTQGDPGERFYLVAAGRLEVLVDGRHVRVHEAGEGFGEIALLHDVPRTATVRALDAVALRALGREDFLAVVAGQADAASAARAQASSRLRFAQPIAAGR